MTDDSFQIKNFHWDDHCVLDTTKQAPKSCENAVHYALSFFPHLHAVHIRFFHKPSILPHRSRPTFKSLFRKRNRVYNVVLSAKTVQDLEDIRFDNLSFNEQVGLIAHELAHVSQYQQLSPFSLLRSFLHYIFPKSRAKYEREADKKAVACGLGWELYAFANARERSSIGNPVLAYLNQFHLSPEDVIHYMQSMQGSSKVDFKIDLTYSLN